ncbi:MAG TPA: DUF2802 domain-containing protein [Marinagarivorans sp.]
MSVGVIENVSFLQVALAAAVGAIWLTTMSLWFLSQRRFRCLNQQLVRLQSELKALQKDQHLALQGSYGMGQRMLNLERRLKSFTDTPQPEPVIEQPFSYTQATQMVEEGADEEAIAATCGISRSEAHLMRKLCAQGLVEPFA